jgi:hypothetical protein
MTNSERVVMAFAAIMLNAGVLAAQGAGAAGPQPVNVMMRQATPTCIAGSAFGIGSYRCASCGFANLPDSAHVVYTFGSEPVVVETVPSSPRIRPGDVVVAVNGQPITTRAGADQFAYPPAGEAVLTVRRGGVNIDVEQLIVPQNACPRNQSSLIRREVSAVDSARTRAGGLVERGTLGARTTGGGRGGAVARAIPPADSTWRPPNSVSGFCWTYPIGYGTTSDSARSVASRTRVPCADSVVTRMQRAADSARRLTTARSVEQMNTALRSGPVESASTVDLTNFGLTLACRPSCTRVRSADGTAYWRFDGYPAVRIQGQGSLAAKAGLMEGDILVLVNDVSPLTDQGALLLNRTERELTLRLEVSRAGQRKKVTLKL